MENQVNNIFSDQINHLINQIDKLINSVRPELNRKLLLHEEQFLRAYKIKMKQVESLFENFKASVSEQILEKKFAERLNQLMKQRDYFKIECLTLHQKYKKIQTQKKGLQKEIKELQICNKSNLELLENLKNKEWQKQKKISNLKKIIKQTEQKLKQQSNSKSTELNKSQQQSPLTINQEQNQNSKILEINKLKSEVLNLQNKISEKFSEDCMKKQLHQIFSDCIKSVKKLIARRKLQSAQHKNNFINLENITFQQFREIDKITLIRLFFTNSQFLDFINKMLFDSKFYIKQHCEDLSSRLANPKDLLFYDFIKPYKQRPCSGLHSSLKNNCFR